jgi:hypothetical protein
MEPDSSGSRALLQHQCESAKTWTCGMMFQEIYCMQDESCFVLLLSKMRGRSDDLIFPECYIGAESENELVVALKLAALLNVFSLVIASRVSLQQLADHHPTTSRRITIHLE